MGGREPLSRNIDHWDLRLGRCVLTIHQNIMINISQRVNWRAFAIHAMFLPSSAIFYFFYLSRLAQQCLSFAYFSLLFYLLHFVNHLCRLAQPPCKRAQRGKVAKKLGKTAQTA